MKLPRRSLAYVWAKRTLAHRHPKWMCWVYVGIAALAAITATRFPGMNGGFVVAAMMFAVLAVDAWCKRGFYEVHLEQEQTIENLRNQRNA